MVERTRVSLLRGYVVANAYPQIKERGSEAVANTPLIKVAILKKG
jgi:hypothetical protein